MHGPLCGNSGIGIVLLSIFGTSIATLTRLAGARDGLEATSEVSEADSDGVGMPSVDESSASDDSYPSAAPREPGYLSGIGVQYDLHFS